MSDLGIGIMVAAVIAGVWLLLSQQAEKRLAQRKTVVNSRRARSVGAPVEVAPVGKHKIPEKKRTQLTKKQSEVVRNATSRPSRSRSRNRESDDLVTDYVRSSVIDSITDYSSSGGYSSSCSGGYSGGCDGGGGD